MVYPAQPRAPSGAHRFARVAAAAAAFVVLELVLQVVCARPAWAVPPFSRKYKTSCQTCHTVFPRLTSIGDAFRMNGYRFPECDGQQIKEEPVSLGNDAYKELFPADAVWPGELPGQVPIGFVPKMRALFYEKGAQETSHMAGLDPWLDVHIAGTLGENISFRGKFQVNGPSCQNCHTYFAMTFQVVRNSSIKVGRFQPDYFNFHQSAFFEMHDLFGPQHHVGANAWNYGKDVGIETAYTAFGRLRAVAGFVEGQDDMNQPLSSKSGYLRLAYRIGGMRMDGAPEEGYTAPVKNWREHFLQFGLLGYAGKARLQSNDVSGAPVTVDDKFYVGGGDFNFVYSDLTVFGGVFGELHSRPTGTAHDIRAERWFGGIRYVTMPWLVPSVMADYFNTELRGDETYEIRPRLEILVRANVKIHLDAAWQRPVGDRMAFRSLEAMLDAGL